MPRAAFQAAMRAAAVTMLTGYAAAADIQLQVYPARPRTIYPPTGFVDGISDGLTYQGLRQRTTQAEVMIVHGLWDSDSAAQQKDAFMDGFIDWCTDNPSAAGPATLVELRASEDVPNWIPEWLPPEQQRSYYATRIVLEGLSLDAN